MHGPNIEPRVFSSHLSICTFWLQRRVNHLGVSWKFFNSQCFPSAPIGLCTSNEMYPNSMNSICHSFRKKFLIQTCFNFHLIVFKLKLLLMTTNCLSLGEVMTFLWPPLKLWHLIPKINYFKLCQATLHYTALQR